MRGMAQAAAPAPTRGMPGFAPPPPPPWPPGGLPPLCSETLAEVASLKSMAPRRRIKRRPVPSHPPNSLLHLPRLCLLPREVIPRTRRSGVPQKSRKATPKFAPFLYDWKAYNCYERSHPRCMLCEKEADDKHLDSWLHTRWTRSAEDAVRAFRWGSRRLSQREHRCPEPRKRPLESWLH